MNTCDDKHDEVVYTVPVCPVCAVKKERDDLEVKLAARDEKINELEGTVADLDYKLDQLNNA